MFLKSFLIFVCEKNVVCPVCPGAKTCTGIVIEMNVTMGQPPPPYTTELEVELQDLLFKNYSRFHRPSQQVVVKVTLSLLTINELNIKDQTLSVSAILSLDWRDERLFWSNNPQLTTDYSVIPFLFSYEEYMWRPPVYMENSVEALSVLSDENIPMRITSRGMVHWNPAGIFKVVCQSDITYYPLDYQTCEIRLTTASYTEAEIRLIFGDPAVNLKGFSRNGEWDLRSAVGAVSEDTERRGQSFSSLTFVLNLRRRYLFHVLNTMFPVALMALLIPMVFKLHVDSGEKIGYSLTVLLAYAVYLTLISDHIPSTSVSICYISIYLASTLAISTISVVFVILVINVHNTADEKPMPDYLRTFALDFLAKISCWNGYCCCCSRKTVRKEKNVISPLTRKKHSKWFEHYESSEPEFTWPMLASILDHFFFHLFMLLVLTTTVSFISIIAAEYVKY